jgi:predicted dinucleotide-binding enzyme
MALVKKANRTRRRIGMRKDEENEENDDLQAGRNLEGSLPRDTAAVDTVVVVATRYSSSYSHGGHSNSTTKSTIIGR